MRKVILLAAALCALFPNSVNATASNMGLAQFGFLIFFYTGRNPYDFDRYGNYCGLKGEEGTPVDAIDTCCQAHDNCYFATSCSGVLSYIFTSYRFKIDTNTKTATCNPFQSQCRRELCDCDVIASQCFKDNLDSYDPNNKRD